MTQDPSKGLKGQLNGSRTCFVQESSFWVQKETLKSKNLDLQDGMEKMEALYFVEVANKLELPYLQCNPLQGLHTTFFFLQNHSKLP